MRILLALFIFGAVLGSGGSGMAAHKTASATRVLTANAVNQANFGDGGDSRAVIVKVEVLLDRHHFSPGEIDGHNGTNFRKALGAFQQAGNLAVTGKLDQETWNALTSGTDEPILTSYTISAADVAGPFDKHIPQRLDQMAKLKALSYQDAREEIAEKFHMAEALLHALNPQAHFDRAGEQIVVANVTPMELRSGRSGVEAVLPKSKDHDRPRAATVIVDIAARDVRAYDSNDKLLAFYPATIGSTEKPAPIGTFAVRRVAWNPDYHYDPKFAWKGVKTNHRFTVRPGPNNPVGLVWIDLTAPSYGIHGTPAPEKISKTESHGCIRLTNWDALDLAAMVHKGTVVKFERPETSATARKPEHGKS